MTTYGLKLDTPHLVISTGLYEFDGEIPLLWDIVINAYQRHIVINACQRHKWFDIENHTLVNNK